MPNPVISAKSQLEDKCNHWSDSMTICVTKSDYHLLAYAIISQDNTQLK